jgi:hypothetical protein
MGEIIPVTIEQYCKNPPRFRINCCDGGTVNGLGAVELHGQRAAIFTGEDGYKQAVAFVEESPHLVLQED